MRILKGLFKILLLPVVLALGLVSALGMTFMKIISYMLGPLVFVLVGCVIYGFATHTLYNVGIACGLIAVVALFLFGAAFILAEADNLKDYLLHL